MWQYRASAISVTDGDTLVMHLDTGFFACTRQRLRLSGFSAPELRELGGYEAKRLLTNKLAEHETHHIDAEWPFVVTTDRDRQTFARFLATSIVCGQGHDIVQELKGVAP